MTNTSKKVSASKHLTLAKHDIARGTTAFRSAANHIAAAIQAGATQAEVAAKVRKSQPWVSRLLKWRDTGFKAGPFDHVENSRLGLLYYPEADQEQLANITSGNNPTRPITRSNEPAALSVKVKADEGSEPESRFPSIAAGHVDFTLTARKQRKMVADAMRSLLPWFGDDAAAMWAAIDAYRAEQQVAAENGDSRRSALH